jgi:hypothetical protein
MAAGEATPHLFSEGETLTRQARARVDGGLEHDRVTSCYNLVSIAKAALSLQLSNSGCSNQSMSHAARDERFGFGSHVAV